MVVVDHTDVMKILIIVLAVNRERNSKWPQCRLLKFPSLIIWNIFSEISASNAASLEIKECSLVATAREESTNPRRLVRVGLIQHSIVVPTDEPVVDQRNAIHNKIEKYIDNAAQAKANVVCLQEAWRK